MNNKTISLFLFLPSLLLSSCGSSTYYETTNYRLELAFHDNYKIMLLTDLLFSISMDVNKEYTHLDKMISNEENIDLIVISGDTFVGENRIGVNSFFDKIDSYDIPFAFTYGETNSSGQYDTYYIADKLSTCKNAKYIDFKDDKLAGLANYYIDLNFEGANKYRLFLLDTNSYYPTGLNYSLDTLHKDQIEHLKNIYRTEPVSALAFFHTPVEEYALASEMYKANLTSGQGENKGAVSFSYTNENKVFNWLKNCGVFATFAGHDYLNYSDINYNNVTLSYGLKSSLNGVSSDSPVGYKLITLPFNKTDFSLNNIESKVVTYE